MANVRPMNCDNCYQPVLVRIRVEYVIENSKDYLGDGGHKEYWCRKCVMTVDDPWKD